MKCWQIKQEKFSRKIKIEVGIMENLELGTVDKSKSMSEILKEALEAKGYSQRSFAKKLGYTPQNFSQRLKKNSFTAEEWRSMAYELGYEVKLVEMESGIEFESRRKGHGRRVRQVINGVLYDTYKADMLCGDFFKDGASEYTDGMAFELYVDYFGRFFVARYTEWENGSDSITTIGKEEAGKLYKKYGDGTLKDSIFI
jgi:transcriptional regulator with XRE-family HTH domain